MEKLVITKDAEAIKSEIERCPQVCKILGSVLTKLQEKGYSPDLDELEKMLQGYCSKMDNFDFKRQSEQIISQYLKHLIIESNHPNQNLLGLKLNKEKFAELLEINHEDVTEILTLLSGLTSEDWNYFKYTDFDSKENKVVLNSDYKNLIDESHTVYAVGKKQIEVTKLLFKVRDNLSELEKICSTEIHKQESIPGLCWKNGRGELDTSFIRKY